MSIQQLDQSVNRFGTTKVGDFLNSHTSPDGSQLIDDPDIPTGTIEITTNGEHNVYDYATANVQVPQPTGTIEITENGEYDVTQYAEADVNIEGITVNESYDISEGTLNGATITLEGDVTAHIPDGVTTIGNRAFMNNTDITKVIMPNSVLTVEDGYSTLETVGAFAYCVSLSDIVFSENLTKIALYMFTNCSSLTSIVIPDSVTSIGASAFRSCTGLTSITISDSVTSIDASAFNGCTGLTSTTIPDSVTGIGHDAFNGCTSLTSITISDSVTSIGIDAFSNCTGLTDIYYTGTQAEWEAIAGISGAGIPETATIHYEYTPE